MKDEEIEKLVDHEEDDIEHLEPGIQYPERCQRFDRITNIVLVLFWVTFYFDK